MPVTMTRKGPTRIMESALHPASRPSGCFRNDHTPGAVAHQNRRIVQILQHLAQAWYIQLVGPGRQRGRVRSMATQIPRDHLLSRRFSSKATRSQHRAPCQSP